MSTYIFPQQALPAPEMFATMTGSEVEIGTLDYIPTKLIFDNLSSSEVIIYISLDGGDTKIRMKTFAGNSAIILDKDLNTYPKGAKFYGVGSSGNFSIAYSYIKM